MNIATELNPKYTITLLYAACIDAQLITISNEHQQYKWAKLEDIVVLGMPAKYKNAIPLIAY